MGKRLLLKVALVSALFAPAFASAATFTEGFEVAPYDFYADAGSSSGISTSVVHSGSQSAQFTLGLANQAYTRWKSGDLTSYGIKVSDLQASDWAQRTLGRPDLTPYLLFTVATPDLTQETLAIQFNVASIPDNTWTQNIVDRSLTAFHVVGDRTGLTAGTYSSSGTQGTLDTLSATTYAGAATWGDFLVTRVRVGVGMWDASQAYNGYVDDVTVLGAVPEPETYAMMLAGLGLLGFMARRRKQKEAAAA